MKLALCQMGMSADEAENLERGLAALNFYRQEPPAGGNRDSAVHPCPQVHGKPTTPKDPAHFAQDPFLAKMRNGRFRMHICMVVMHILPSICIIRHRISNILLSFCIKTNYLPNILLTFSGVYV